MSETYDLFQQGRAHLRKGRAAQATVPLEKAKAAEPEKASIREALGIAYFRIQRWDEAEAEFRKLLELSPADDYAHYALGRALEKQGRVAEANGHYKLAASLRPGDEHYASRILKLDSDDAEKDAEPEPGADG
jgi:Flp pilus assembly protein TadD